MASPDKKFTFKFKTIRHSGKNLISKKHAKPVLFVSVFAAIAVIALLVTKAATPFASLEPEQGTKSSGIINITDTAASSGAYVQFGGGTTTPPPPPGGGCPPFPSFPDVNCTGYKHTGVTLTNYTGSNTITAAGTVIDGKLINGSLSICANNVTIKRSKIMGTVNTGYAHTNYACGSPSGFSGIVLEDVEIDGGNDASTAAIGAHGYTCRRCYAHNTGLGFNGSNFTVEDSYIHDVYGERDCTKYPSDCISHNSVSNPNNGSNIKLIHNNLVAVYSSQTTGGGMSAAITMYTHGDVWGAMDNIVIEKNRIESRNSSFCVYGGYSRDSNTGEEEWPTNLRFVDNYFYLNPDTNNCGGGPIVGWRRGSGNIWLGNMLLSSSGVTTPLVEPVSNPY